MHKKDLQALNEAILLAAHISIKQDTDQACLLLGIDKRSAELIGGLPITKIKAIAKEVTVLLQPSTVTQETWLKFAQAPDESLNIVFTLADE